MIVPTQLLEDVDEEFESTDRKLKVSMQQLWHEQFRHPGQDKTKSIIKRLGSKSGLDPETALTCCLLL